ncbi:hypothetical protein OG204_14275 [Streptomyces sp. NBC_01387]|uniref:hypothetical protein n=1 Tax=unclassified Streptomyces TaxID=2593676 RepID=UPI002024E42C|nr:MULTISPECIES: hypothetical protein [unclassified Streptomyces]MCX4550494.1 hypothetical protein [Streptomyces sp. NBC_01500]WSC21942.1 hypothetical protein OIE60_20895 [Streptomyces sp. NBC_01766]WSV55897.1 hypothetical protein OG282_20535 [Streptomyces sp. NBC_01014]
MPTPLGPLPAIDSLSQRQQRGMDCVWCGITLAPGTAVDLGPRDVRILDHTTQWFPRACKRHDGTAAYRAVLAHAEQCPDCLTTGCPVGAQLRRIVRETRK